MDEGKENKIFSIEIKINLNMTASGFQDPPFNFYLSRESCHHIHCCLRVLEKSHIISLTVNDKFNLCNLSKCLWKKKSPLSSLSLHVSTSISPSNLSCYMLDSNPIRCTSHQHTHRFESCSWQTWTVKAVGQWPGDQGSRPRTTNLPLLGRALLLGCCIIAAPLLWSQS